MDSRSRIGDFGSLAELGRKRPRARPWLVVLAFSLGMQAGLAAWAQPIGRGLEPVSVEALEQPRAKVAEPRTPGLAMRPAVQDESQGPRVITPTAGSELPPLPPLPVEPFPRVIPLAPQSGGDAPGPAVSAPIPRLIQLPRDTTGLAPDRPPGPPPRRPGEDVARDVTNMIEMVNEPEAEISLVEGQSRIIKTRRELTRILIANPAVADVELLTDQPGARLVNVYGKASGTTNLTLWDQTDRPLSFLVRVTLDTRDLESRIRQAFPGADVKVRQVGPQVILEGQVPDSKTMADVLQVVTIAVASSGAFRAGMTGGTGGGMGMAGGTGGGMGGGAGTGGMAGGGLGRGLVLVNRVTVPGPRQILLHVKFAEINRSATRDIGVSWLYARGKSIIGSAIGPGATFPTATTTTSIGQALGKRGFARSIDGSVGGAISASPNVNAPLFGVFDAGHFSLFIEALRSNSLAKILAEPNLVALDGQPARFLVGGMFPFPVPQSSSIPGGTAVVTVQFQRFGTILTFVPQILPNDVIRLDVEPVISNLNFAQTTTVNGGIVPSITERSARTVVELREGQTLAIAGLLQLTTNAVTKRIPGLGDLPLVGPWFSADHVETVETETIVLVTPELVAPLEGHEVTESPGDRVFQPNDPEFYLLGRIEGKLGREFRATKGEQDPLNLMKHFQSEQQWVIGPHGHAD